MIIKTFLTMQRLGTNVFKRWSNMRNRMDNVEVPLGSKICVVIMPGEFNVIHNGIINTILRAQFILKHKYDFEFVHIVICPDNTKLRIIERLNNSAYVFNELEKSSIYVYDTRQHEDLNGTFEYLYTRAKEIMKTTPVYCLIDHENKDYVNNTICDGIITVGVDITSDKEVIKIESGLQNQITGQMILTKLTNNESIKDFVPKCVYNYLTKPKEPIQDTSSAMNIKKRISGNKFWG